MRVQVYNAYAGQFTIIVATPRPQEAASAHFVAAKIHEDYCAQVRKILREYKHINATALEFPAAKRLQTYLPVFPLVTGQPLYAIRELRPAGAPRDIDADYMLEIMRIRYAFTLVCLPAYSLADEIDAEAIERHMEYGVEKLLEANGLSTNTLPTKILLPGDNELIDGEKTTISVSCQLDGATARGGVDIPSPSLT
jgi:hypothetical protein